MRTLIQLTTTATLAACLQLNTVGTANATRLASNSTTNLTKDRSTSTVWKVAPTSRFAHYPKYEPDPNGNPKSDGTGTRWQNLTALARAVADRGRDRRLWWKPPSSILVFSIFFYSFLPSVTNSTTEIATNPKIRNFLLCADIRFFAETKWILSDETWSGRELNWVAPQQVSVRGLA